MLDVPEKKRYTKISAIKTLSKGFIRSGDVYATEGKRNIQRRKNTIRDHNDLDVLAKDWITIGNDMSESMDNFKKENSL